ncbi:MAG: DUF721 domain-containing protein [Bacteroidetes bacterium]|nr:DUF721 domain-containing protein [Bacteroidota bacterium]
MRKKNESTIKEAIQELLDAYRLRAGLNQVEIKKIWEDMMGPYVAKETDKLKLEKGVLHIKVKSAPLKHELMMMKSKIIEKINAELKQNLIQEIQVW